MTLNVRGSALIVVLIGIGIITLLIASFGKSALRTVEESDAKKEERHLKFQSIDILQRIQRNLLVKVQSVIDNSRNCNNLSKPLLCSNPDAAQNTCPSTHLPLCFSPESVYTAGTGEAFILKPLGEPERTGTLSTYTVTSNAQASSFPKKIHASIRLVGAHNAVAILDSDITFDPVAFNKWAYLVTGSSTPIYLGENTYAGQTGFFFTSNDTALLLQNPAPRPLTFQRLLSTNLPQTHLQSFGQVHTAFGPNGPITYAEGVRFEAPSPATDIVTAFNGLKDSDSTIKFTHPSQASAASSIISLGDDQDDCAIKVEDIYLEQDCSGAFLTPKEIDQIGGTLVASLDFLPSLIVGQGHNASINSIPPTETCNPPTPQPVAHVVCSGAACLDHSAIFARGAEVHVRRGGNLNRPATICQNNTFIGHGDIILDTPILKSSPGNQLPTEETSAGISAFVSLTGVAGYINGTTKTLSSAPNDPNPAVGPTISERWNSNSQLAQDASAVTFKAEAAFVSLAREAISLAPQFMDISNGFKNLGIAEIKGTVIAKRSSLTKQTSTLGDRPGSYSGFRYVTKTYDEELQSAGLPGFEATTTTQLSTSLHNISFSVTTLDDAMATIGASPIGFNGLGIETGPADGAVDP